MGNQQHTPNSQTQQPGTRQPSGAGEQRKRKVKAKDSGNVPRSDDDVVSEGNQGTREDGAGSNSSQ
jgi:hypothetical protein